MIVRYSRFYAVIVILAPCIAVLSSSQGAAALQPPWEVTVDASFVTIHTDSAPLLRYRYGDVPFKPYIKELFTPSGVNVLLDSPPDHVHHHGLMFACDVNGVDFWGETAGQVSLGKQWHERFRDVGVVGPPRCRWASFTETIRWSPSDGGEPRLLEQRTITAGRAGTPVATVLTWESQLVAYGKGPVVLSGSHYHGLGMRFIRSMDTDGEFRNPDNDRGVIFRGEERLLRSRWCAYTAKAEGKLVTVAMFDHPENPRYPATWFTMTKPFAYLSATMRLHEEPLTVARGQSLVLRYGVALWDGRPESTQIDELCDLWVGTQPFVGGKR